MAFALCSVSCLFLSKVLVHFHPKTLTPCLLYHTGFVNVFFILERDVFECVMVSVKQTPQSFPPGLSPSTTPGLPASSTQLQETTTLHYSHTHTHTHHTTSDEVCNLEYELLLHHQTDSVSLKDSSSAQFSHRSIHPSIPEFTHSSMYSSTDSAFINPFIHPSIHRFFPSIYYFVHPFIILFIHLLIPIEFIHSSIHPLMYPYLIQS